MHPIPARVETVTELGETLQQVLHHFLFLDRTLTTLVYSIEAPTCRHAWVLLLTASPQADLLLPFSPFLEPVLPLCIALHISCYVVQVFKSEWRNSQCQTLTRSLRVQTIQIGKE